MINLLKRFFAEDGGLGTLEIIVILVVFICMALFFREQIFSFVDMQLNRIFANS